MESTKARTVAMAEGFRSVVEALKEESDRGTVVLAAAWLDESLTRIIAKFLKPVSPVDEKLLKAGQPIGDLGTKIILAERLNLVHPDLLSSLSLMRKLRNDFAHLSSHLSFPTPNVKDRVSELFKRNEDLLLSMAETLIEAGMLAGPGKSGTITAKDMEEAFGSKQLFHYTCGFLNSALAIIEYDLKPSEPQFEI